MRVWIVERVCTSGEFEHQSDVVSAHSTELGAEDKAYELQLAEYRKLEAKYMFNVYPVELFP